jgi:pSer/pThr/pTyr-binding forkhead associated (FHA) protein
MPMATGARTVFEDASEAAERLMGFLVVLQSREEEEWRYFRLKKGVNFIGRFGSRCDIELRDRESSQQHALLVCTNSATRIIDLDSSNGTLVQGRRLEIAQLAEGDRIQVGRTILMYVPFPYVAED